MILELSRVVCTVLPTNQFKYNSSNDTDVDYLSTLWSPLLCGWADTGMPHLLSEKQMLLLLSRQFKNIFLCGLHDINVDSCKDFLMT